MTETATIGWFGRWGTSVFSENTAIFTNSTVLRPSFSWHASFIDNWRQKILYYTGCIACNFHHTESESESLLVTSQNDNHSPGPGPGRLVPSSHQRSELSNTIVRTFSRGDKRVWKCILVPSGLGEKATLINISVSNGNLICRRMITPAVPN